MNSINRNQPEATQSDLSAGAAVAKIKEIIDKAATCFFCTTSATSEAGGVRPMNVRQVDDQGNLWFLSANDSHKNQEVQANPTVQLFMQEDAQSGFLHLTGRATISTDKPTIKELWTPT